MQQSHSSRWFKVNLETAKWTVLDVVLHQPAGTVTQQRRELLGHQVLASTMFNELNTKQPRQTVRAHSQLCPPGWYQRPVWLTHTPFTPWPLVYTTFSRWVRGWSPLLFCYNECSSAPRRLKKKPRQSSWTLPRLLCDCRHVKSPCAGVRGVSGVSGQYCIKV